MAGLNEQPLGFAKLSGSGNDFILVDNLDGRLENVDLADLARAVCHRHTSVGADGLIVIEKSDAADFRWQFFNADGSRADMCGNGGRCAARYAVLRGIAPPSMRFETGAGVIEARVDGSTVAIELTRPHGYQDNIVLDLQGMEYRLSGVNTGVPHAVLLLNDASLADVLGLGQSIRRHPRFAPAGTNVNFVQVIDRGSLKCRTYERGVEGETLACGTGAAASALVTWRRGLTDAEVAVVTSGGEVLRVRLEPVAGQDEPRVFLQGRTILVCQGEIDPEGYTSEERKESSCSGDR